MKGLSSITHLCFCLCHYRYHKGPLHSCPKLDWTRRSSRTSFQEPESFSHQIQPDIVRELNCSNLFLRALEEVPCHSKKTNSILPDPSNNNTCHTDYQISTSRIISALWYIYRFHRVPLAKGSDFHST